MVNNVFKSSLKPSTFFSSFMFNRKYNTLQMTKMNNIFIALIMYYICTHCLAHGQADT